MVSIEFTRERAQATHDTQAVLAATPGWVWGEKTVIEWGEEVALIDTAVTEESSKRTQWRAAAESWQAGLDDLQALTRQVVSIGKIHFRNDVVKKILFDGLATDGRSRAEIYEQALAARDVWQEADPAWNLSATDTLAAFSALLTGSITKQAAHSAKHIAWRAASVKLMNKARQVDEDCVAWFAEATRRFPEGTTEGDLIRSAVPTTTRPEPPVGQTEISNLVVDVSTIHFDVEASSATRFTYLHQAPGSPSFVVVLADVPEASLTLENQPNGVHRFKAFGSNSTGSGAESVVAEITVAAAAAA